MGRMSSVNVFGKNQHVRERASEWANKIEGEQDHERKRPKCEIEGLGSLR